MNQRSPSSLLMLLHLTAALPLVLVAAAQAQAPADPPPASPPPHQETDVERGIRELEAAARKSEPVRPSVGPFTNAAPSKSPAPRLIREGTFLVDRRGRVARASGGEQLFVFDADAAGRAEQPMPLLPCQYLENLLSTATRTAGAGEPVAFKISGQVLAYQGRNYLLLTRPADVVRPTQPPAPTTQESKPTAAPPTTPPATKTPAPAKRPATEAERIMGELESAAPAPAAVVPLPASAPSGQTTRSAPSYREGTFIASRRGRMARSGSGWILVFDTDPQSPGDAPIHLLPCVNLMSMEDLATRGGDSVSMAVSGQVYTYQGRSYLLPTMYIVQPRAAR